MLNRRSFLALLILITITAASYGCSAPVSPTTIIPPATTISKYASASNMGLRLTVDASNVQPKLNETINISITLDDVSNNSTQPRMVTGSVDIKNQAGQAVWSATIPRIPGTSSTTSPFSSPSSSPNIPATQSLWSIGNSYSWVIKTDSNIGIAVTPGKYNLYVTDNFYPNATAQQTESISIQPIELTIQ